MPQATKIAVTERTAAIRLTLANGDAVTIDVKVGGVYRLFSTKGEPLFNADRTPAYNLDAQIAVTSKAKP